MACRPNTTMLCLRTDPTEDTNERAELDVKDEIDEFDKDLNFLSFIQSDDVYNVKIELRNDLCVNKKLNLPSPTANDFCFSKQNGHLQDN